MSDKVETLDLKKFNMARVGDDKVCTFIGKRKTGKSWGVKDLLFYNKHIPSGVVMSGTEIANKFYSRIIPDEFIHDEFDDDLIENILQRQVDNRGIEGTISDLDDDEFDIVKKSNIGCLLY
jgi:hypothetical protein